MLVDLDRKYQSRLKERRITRIDSHTHTHKHNKQWKFNSQGKDDWWVHGGGGLTQ